MAPIWHKIGPNDPVPEDAFVCFEAVSAAQPVIHLARMTYRGNTLVGHVIHGKAYFVYQGEMHTSREFEVLLLNGSNLIWKQADECGHSLKAGTAMGHFGSRVPVCIGKLANLRGAGQVCSGMRVN
ncbi:Hypothetical predicted protein [Cloeon dipterum]|uniref:Uncharacterized protein n=1 Tax=Cloeon dipterum TaxID=197152 RepID=A0A8S1BYP9_9INSE|nr:Hypothetical predicted protein [Cloeon dipterum]